MSIFSRLFCKKKKSESMVLGEDYLLCIDLSSGEAQVRFCFIESILKNGNIKVRVPFYNKIMESYYVQTTNNFYFVDQKDLVDTYIMNLKSLQELKLNEDIKTYERSEEVENL